MAREARFDRFTHNDVVTTTVKSGVSKEGGVVRIRVSKMGEGEKIARLGILMEGKKGEGVNKVTVGSVVVSVGREQKIRRVAVRESGQAVGRFIQAYDCTVEKARLDFARILISTPIIEIVNKSYDFIIDGSKHVIKLVEEWGCNLGEDAFLTEVESDSRPETSLHHNDVEGLDEVQGEW